ncbi:uncharacterized protein [Euphorbia lathyris]|uniref:uncharacterized protein n=1 Tax=Euphorbia lathyris TaxID=212925 RepID=UPI0033132BC7
MFTDWLLQAIGDSNLELLDKLCCALKAIWDHRNRVLWNMSWWPADISWRHGIDELRDWRAYQQSHQAKPLVSPPILPGSLHRQHQGAPSADAAPSAVRPASSHCSSRADHAIKVWKPPKRGYMKCNVDGAIFKEVGSCGMGAVIRDDSGTFLFCSSSCIASTREPKVIEALALRTSLIWLASLRYTHVEFESDAKLVIDAILSNKKDISEFGMLINDCRVVLRSNPTFSVSYVSRLANRAAHSVARQAYSNASDFFIF